MLCQQEDKKPWVSVIQQMIKSLICPLLVQLITTLAEPYFSSGTYSIMGWSYITLDSHRFPTHLQGKKEPCTPTHTHAQGLNHPSVAAGTFWLIPDPLLLFIMLQNIVRELEEELFCCHDKKKKTDKMSMRNSLDSVLCLLQACQHPVTILQGCPCNHSKSLHHLQPFHLCHHPQQIQVNLWNRCHHLFITPSLSNILDYKSQLFSDLVGFNRMTLAEKFPCLRFLSPTPRKDCISSSISESSFRDSIISRQSTASRTKFITASPGMVISFFVVVFCSTIQDSVERQNWINYLLILLSLFSSRYFCCTLQVLKDVQMEPLGRKSGDSFRSTSSHRQSYRSRSYKKQLEQEVTKTQSAEKVRKEQLLFTIPVWSCLNPTIFCLHAFICSCFMNYFVLMDLSFIFLFFIFLKHPSAMNESLSTCEHELVSSSLTVATLPLLVLTRRRSQSLTSDISDVREEKGCILGHRRSDSFDSLNFRKITSTYPRSPQRVPRIIVISPTSESSLIHHDSVCLEESAEVTENNVFVSLNFSSEVFEAVELLSWPAAQ